MWILPLMVALFCYFLFIFHCDYVFSDVTKFWFMLINRYFRHASGEMFVVSRAVAQFISINKYVHGNYQIFSLSILIKLAMIYPLFSKSQAYYSWSQSPISLNARSILRTFAHDDVSVGSWMIGLDVKHVNEGKLCCSSWSSGLSLH